MRQNSAGPRVVAVLVGVLALVLATSAITTPVQAEPAGAPVAIATLDGTPWEIALLPAGGAFITQRDGGIAYLDPANRVSVALARTAIPTVRKLLGLALAPDFAVSGLAYLYVSQSTDPDGGGPANGVNGIWRLRASGGTLQVVDRVFTGIASDGSHDGGRMVFGPDGALYVTTGDIHEPSRPQDPTSLNGKILRLGISASGPADAPTDNPFARQGGGAPWVWSLGHRHPQGLVFDAQGRLWEDEHGPSGENHGSAYPGGDRTSGRDELNLIQRGGNYGWPLVSGPANLPGMIAPMAVAGDAPAWAPGDLTIGADGSLYAPFLAGNELRRFDVRGGVVAAQASHLTNLGRLRVAVTEGQSLLVAADAGSAATIYRVPLTGPAPGGAELITPLLGPAPGPAPGQAPGGSGLSPAQVEQRARTLTRRVVGALRERGSSALLRGRPLALRGPVPDSGTIRISVHLVGGDTVTAKTFGPERLERRRYVLTIRGPGNARLRAAGARAQIVVRVAVRSADGALIRATQRARLTPRGR